VYFFCFFVVIECTIFICACMYFMYFIFLCLEIFYVVKFCWMVVVTLCSTLHISVCKQEVWPPDSADMVCPRPPLMRQIQHFVSRIKNRQRWDVQAMWAYELDLWPWGSPRLSVIHVSVLCQSTKCQFWWYSDYLFLICGPLGQHGSDWSRDLATLTFDLGGHGACGWCGSSSSIRVPSWSL